MTCIVSMDVASDGDSAFGAAIAFAPWDAATPRREIDAIVEGVAPYEPGAFFKRELPVLVELLERARALDIEPSVLVVDGYARFFTLAARDR